MTKRDLREATIARLLKKGGLRAHIDAMCCWCIYDPLGGAGTWRQQVGACTSTTCPLYAVRTASRGGKTATSPDCQPSSQGSNGSGWVEENAAPGASEAA